MNEEQTKEIIDLKQEIKRMKKIYADELKRKDGMIEELRSQNDVIFKSAIKSSEKINDLTHELEKAMRKQQAKQDKEKSEELKFTE
jgi:hypothetical protein